MENVKFPLTSVSAEDVYPPPERVTVPDGAAPEPVTATGTLSVELESKVLDAGVTVTVAASKEDVVTATVAAPLAVP
jgi:hypothetical protein